MATLVDILVTPLSPTVVNGHTVQLTAIGTYDDNTEADLTATVNWTSGTPGHATVGLHTGLVTGVATGTSVITATSGAVTGAQTVTSGIGALQSITVTGTASRVKGQTSQLTATGTYADTSTADITTSADWASSVPAAATVGLHTGLVTAVEVGAANITATVGAVVSPVLAFTTHNALVSIAVTPGSPSKAKGQTQQMTATGTYEDSSTADLTATATWASATPAHATVSATGLATAVAVGTAVIGATSGAVEGHTTMNVGVATLVSIAVTPAAPTVINGHTLQMTATGTYTDATTADLTATGTWASATPSHASVGAATGLVMGVADGTAVVGCTVSAVEGHTTVTSTKGYLVSLSITPAAPAVLQGQTQALVATGTYQDASTEDLTTTATWTSSVTGVATVGAHTGLLTAVAGGDSANTTIAAAVGLIAGSTVAHVSPLVQNFFVAHDAQNDSAWTAVAFGFLANMLVVCNVSGVEVQLSFDGVNAHGILDAATDAAGHSAIREFDFVDGGRAGLWLKRTTGIGGGAKTVRVEAANRYIYGQG